MGIEAIFSSRSDEWETPEDLFQLLNMEFKFTLDPCASFLNHKCDRYFTKDDDGLKQSWAGETVFCNPPYGKDISRWMAKGYLESRKPETTIVFLVPARTDTKWFHDWVYGKAEIRFVKGRIHFSGSKGNAPFPSMIVIYRKEFENE